MDFSLGAPAFTSSLAFSFALGADLKMFDGNTFVALWPTIVMATAANSILSFGMPRPALDAYMGSAALAGSAKFAALFFSTPALLGHSFINLIGQEERIWGARYDVAQGNLRYGLSAHHISGLTSITGAMIYALGAKT